MTTPTPAALICPKCRADMSSYERNGVTIDQCMGCRGIFLDRGELERLVDAEGAYYNAAANRGGDQVRGRPASEHSGQHGGDHDYRGKPRRRGGFLGELFD